MQHQILDLHVVALNQSVNLKTLFQQDQATLQTYDKSYLRKFTYQNSDLKLAKPYDQADHILMWYLYNKHVYVIDERGAVKRFSQRKSPQIVEKLLTHYYA